MKSAVFSLTLAVIVLLAGCHGLHENAANTNSVEPSSGAVIPKPASLNANANANANANVNIEIEIDLLRATASEMLPLLRSGKVSVAHYMDVLLAHSEHYAGLNAFITVDADQVRTAARQADAKRLRGEVLGPLFGIPFSLKDIIVTADIPTSFGTRVLAGYESPRNAPVVGHLLGADAILFGKNNNQEWAFGSNGYNSHYGQQLNPYNPDHIAGGSSGGGATAVSAGMLPIAIGSDTAASIRVPAGFTGLYGLRPTTGRYDNSGVAPIAPTLDTIGPLTRSVADLAIIDSVLTQTEYNLPKIELSSLRLGVPRGYFAKGVSVEMRTAFDELLETLILRGVTLVEVELPNAALTDQGLYPILFGEARQAVTDFLQHWVPGSSFHALHAGLGSDVQGMWDQLVVEGAPEGIPPEIYQDANQRLRAIVQDSYSAYFADNQVDALIFPATAHSAPLAKPDNPQDTQIDGKTVSIFIHDHNSSPGAFAGQPGIVLPMSLSRAGLPLGVSLDGKRGQDRELMAIGQAIDAVIGKIPGPDLQPK